MTMISEQPAGPRLKAKAPFTPQGNMRKLWGCRHREILLEGPAGTGKTRCLLEKAYFIAMKYAGTRILLVRKTRESMTQTVLQIFEKWVVPQGSYLLEGPSRKMRESYILQNGSEIVVAGLDKPEKVMSSEYDIIAAFESTELTENDFELLTTRLARVQGNIPYQQIVCDCNPDAPSHWLNRRAMIGHMTRIETRHTDNPNFFDIKLGKWTKLGEDYIAGLMKLSGVRRERLLNGKWVLAEGAVYPEFQHDSHVIDKMPEGWKDWRKVRSVDFGFQNPFVCLWAAIDSDGDIFIYREIYKSGRIVSEHVSGVWDENEQEKTKTLVTPGIKQLSAEDGYIEATVADHDKEDRETMAKEGVYTSPAYKEKDTGIEAVKLRLRPQLHATGEVKPRIFFLKGCTVEIDDDLIEDKLPFCTVDEFSNYRYPKAKPDKAVKEEPIDKDNHGMDALRYLVCYVDDVGGTQIEVIADAPAAVDDPQYRQW